MSKNLFRKDVSIVICGEAGQGIQTVESISCKPLKWEVIMFSHQKNTCHESEGVKTPQKYVYHQKELHAYVESD